MNKSNLFHFASTSILSLSVFPWIEMCMCSLYIFLQFELRAFQNDVPLISFFVVQLYVKDASRSWKLVGSEGGNQLSIKEPSGNIVLLDYLASEKWKDIIDFDDHLDDISK